MVNKKFSFFWGVTISFFFICFLFFFFTFFFYKIHSFFEANYLFFVHHSFGASAYGFLIICLFSIVETIRGKDLSKIFLLNILLYLVLFYFNLILLNFPSLYNSIYAGVYPKFIHAILIHFLGTKNLSSSFFSIFAEVLLFLFHLALFLFYLNFKFKKYLSIFFKFFSSLYANGKKIKNRWIQEFKKTIHTLQIKNITSTKKKILQKISIEELQTLKGNETNQNLEILKKEETSFDKSIKQENKIEIETYEKNKDRKLQQETQPEELQNKITEKESKNSSSIENEVKEKPQPIDEKKIEEDFYRRPAVLNSTQTFDDFINQQKNQNKSLISFYLLKENNEKVSEQNKELVTQIAKKLEKTIADFGVNVKVVKISIGPVITQYELTIEKGVSLHKVTKLHSDIALSLAAKSLRIIAPIPGKSVIGIEIPNPKRDLVSFRECVESETFFNSNAILPVILGKSILGEIEIADIAATPHLLVAGATGSGKSVCINTIICSLLYRLSCHQVRFLMIDPKMVKLNIYNGIPHLLSPVIVDPKKAALSLRWLISEMESRYYLLEKHGVRNIVSYNEIIIKKNSDQENIEKNKGLETLPYIVVVIDEFADLMMIAKKEIEDSISRLAAMSRAVGIHLILATQRPSVDVITGVIKANFPSRIAFQVSSQIDSRTIIDGQGAENLLGKGDLLFKNSTLRYLLRIQCSFLSDEEVQKITEELKENSTPNYIDDIFEVGENTDKNISFEEVEDELYQKALEVIMNDKKASASYLQRKLKIGYNRAARIVELMEKNGIVSPPDGSKPRKILI